MRKVLLDGNVLADRNTAHRYLKVMLEFPEYYGENLDALYDMLTDLADVEIEIIRPEIQTSFYHKILSVFRRAQKETTVTVREIENFEYNE